MRKKILTMVLACALCFSAMPTTVSADEWDDLLTDTSKGEDREDPALTDVPVDPDPEPEPEPEPYDACTIGPEDLCVKPAKKIMAKGSTFKITVAMNESSDLEELSDEEWDALYEHDVASVEYRSNKPSIAKVNAKGKVTAKKTGNCRITTTIYFIDGTTWPLRTRVFVSR